MLVVLNTPNSNTNVVSWWAASDVYKSRLQVLDDTVAAQDRTRDTLEETLATQERRIRLRDDAIDGLVARNWELQAGMEHKDDFIAQGLQVVMAMKGGILRLRAGVEGAANEQEHGPITQKRLGRNRLTQSSTTQARIKHSAVRSPISSNSLMAVSREFTAACSSRCA